MPADPARATLTPRARARLNAGAHELRPSDAALAGGVPEFLLVRKDEGATLAVLRVRDDAALDLHLAREKNLLPEIAAALPPLLARLAPRLALPRRVQLRVLVGGASLGGRPRRTAALAASATGFAGAVRRQLARAAADMDRSRRDAPPPGPSPPLRTPPGYGEARGLRRCREPRVLDCVGLDAFGRNQWLAPRAARAWLAMRDAAAREGVELQLVSAFRSVAYQRGLFRRKLARGLTMEEILRVNAAPGFSEHHTGRAIDIGTPGYAPAEEEFERSTAFAWLRRHAARHRFRLSYPRGNPHGIAYEPWHWYFAG